ncbi:MAG: CBS domain-containing protein [Thermoleophilia bacterium]|nr:CBS domain-containing protein [Thermoleophilia bacterium]
MIDRPVRELMDSSTPTVAPDTTIKDLVYLLATKHLDGVAVVDSGNAVVGVVTAQDMLFQEVEADEHVPYVAPFLDWMIYIQSLGSWERHIEKAFAVTVSDLMTNDVITASPDEALHEAAKRMAKDGVSQLPVVEHGAYVGMLTRGHVVAALNRFEFGGGAA